MNVPNYPNLKGHMLVAALIIVISIVAGLTYSRVAVAADAGAQAPAAAGSFLADKHKAAGIDCKACHTESPSKPPTKKACLQCHGPSYASLATKTDKVEPNPHASHQGDLDCASCHHGHKASVDFCAQCHTFGFTVP